VTDLINFLIFLVLVGLTVPIIALILGVVNFLKLRNLEEKIQNLSQSKFQNYSESKVISQNPEQKVSTTSIRPETTIAPSPQQIQIPNPQASTNITHPDIFTTLLNWIKEDWILKLGSLLILIGFGWFTSYLFVNNLIGPIGRILIGILIGTGFLIFGTQRLKNFSLQGGIFLTLGSGIVLLTVFAGRVAFDLYPPTLALIFMFLVSVYVSFVSVINNNKSVSILGVCIGLLAPLLTSSPTGEYVYLFMYLIVVYIGSLWIIYKTQTRAINLISLGFIFLYSLPYLVGFATRDREIVILLIFAFSGLLFLSTIENILKSLKFENLKINVVDIVTSALNGVFIVLWIINATSPEWKSLTAVAWSLVFAFGSYFTLRITKNYYPFYVHFLISLAMLLTATAIQLKGASVFYAVLFQIMTASILAYSLLKKLNFAQFINIFLIIPIFMSFSHLSNTEVIDFIDNQGRRGMGAGIILNPSFFLNPSYYVILIFGISLCLLGLFYRKEVRDSQEKWVKFVNTAIIIIGSLFVFRSIWLTLYEILQNNDIARAFTMFVITAISLTSYFYGIYEGRRVPKYYGGIMVGLVVINILLFEIWGLSILGRVVTLFLVGSLLLSTAFISKNIEKNQNGRKSGIININ